MPGHLGTYLATCPAPVVRTKHTCEVSGPLSALRGPSNTASTGRIEHCCCTCICSSLSCSPPPPPPPHTTIAVPAFLIFKSVSSSVVHLLFFFLVLFFLFFFFSSLGRYLALSSIRQASKHQHCTTAPLHTAHCSTGSTPAHLHRQWTKYLRLPLIGYGVLAIVGTLRNLWRAPFGSILHFSVPF